MVKRKFGDSVQAKNDQSMKCEILVKFVCHNLCCLIQEQHELGIDPLFWQDEVKPVAVMKELTAPRAVTVCNDLNEPDTDYAI